MTTIVKAENAQGFLGLVPTLLGFQPVESLVLVPFAGKRTLGAMRVDLPPYDHDAYDETAATVVGLVCKIDVADGVAAIAYSTTRTLDEVEALLRSLMVRAEQCGLRLVDVLYVAADGWGSLIGGDQRQPLDMLAPTEVPGIAPPVANQLAGTELPVLSDELLGHVVMAMATFEPDYMTNPLELIEAILEIPPAELGAEQIAWLSWMLDRPALRDILLVQWCQDMEAGEEALEAQLNWEQGAEYPTHLAMHMWGEGPRPNPERLMAGLELVRITASAMPTAGAFSVAGWLSWALGRSSHASHYAEQGLALDEEHGMCEIVRAFVTSGHLPSWAFDRG